MIIWGNTAMVIITKPYRLLLLAIAMVGPLAAADERCPALLDFQFRPLAAEQTVSLCEQHAGKVVLVVNTASFCGYTDQYRGLESLYDRYRDRGLVVLGFPSNDFAQEQGSEAEIKEFCQLTYKVGFPMYEKLSVRDSDSTHPFYKQLAERSGQSPRWDARADVRQRPPDAIKRQDKASRTHKNALSDKVGEFSCLLWSNAQICYTKSQIWRLLITSSQLHTLCGTNGYDGLNEGGRRTAPHNHDPRRSREVPQGPQVDRLPDGARGYDPFDESRQPVALQEGSDRRVVDGARARGRSRLRRIAAASGAIGPVAGTDRPELSFGRRLAGYRCA